MSAYPAAKRAIDIAVSSAGIVILIPLFIVLSLWIKATSEGPVLYNHTRIGRGGKPFEICKFRSMVVGARDMQKKGVPEEKLTTHAGRFMRNIFIDETPQLLNVLKGDISLVGPRPLDKEAFDRLVMKDGKWRDIVSVRPGITGLESVADYLPGKERDIFEKKFEGLKEKDVSPDYYEHRYVLDRYYIENRSVWWDIKIIFYTFLLIAGRIFGINFI